MSDTISRRQFLVQLAVLGSAAVLAPGCKSRGSSGNWLSAGSASTFKAGDFTLVTLPDATKDVIYVTEQANGSYLALSSRCTHRGCTVAWNSTQKMFICPCHGGRFDATGKNISGPPPSPLVVLATKMDGQGNLLVQSLAGPVSS